ncbi:DUF2304 domain-containing protein [Christensenellaceae bacterium OttesenSCG-928-K19]|nr:DUF2304 domain-containing protein [Christensenellaceae bacterium OttesenSCG-928-K19]
MSVTLRVILIIASLLALFYVLRKIRQSKMNIVDSIFWIVLVAVFILLAVFPQIAYFFANLAGIQTPINFILLFIIAMLFIKVFLMTIRISQQDEKIKKLAQRIAIDEYEERKDKTDDEEQ